MSDAASRMYGGPAAVGIGESLLGDTPSTPASRMYGPTGPAPATSTPTEPSAKPAEAVADRMFPSTPPAPPEAPPPAPAAPPKAAPAPADVLAARAADPSRRMFGESLLKAEVPDNSIEGVDVPELRQVLGDFCTSPQEASEFRHLASAIMKTPATAEVQQGWFNESVALADEMNVTEQDAAAMQRMVNRDPRASEFLARTGLWQHPKVVKALVGMARAAAIKNRSKA